MINQSGPICGRIPVIPPQLVSTSLFSSLYYERLPRSPLLRIYHGRDSLQWSHLDLPSSFVAHNGFDQDEVASEWDSFYFVKIKSVLLTVSVSNSKVYHVQKILMSWAEIYSSFFCFVKFSHCDMSLSFFLIKSYTLELCTLGLQSSFEKCFHMTPPLWLVTKVPGHVSV